ncbi:hypothetical protein F5X98DRAFT_385186 [Xylaria grammica]|nr:hypothetical protein F5X98DRAFT_385186 [Xylaria grammica]
MANPLGKTRAPWAFGPTRPRNGAAATLSPLNLPSANLSTYAVPTQRWKTWLSLPTRPFPCRLSRLGGLESTSINAFASGIMLTSGLGGPPGLGPSSNYPATLPEGLDQASLVSEIAKSIVVPIATYLRQQHLVPGHREAVTSESTPYGRIWQHYSSAESALRPRDDCSRSYTGPAWRTLPYSAALRESGLPAGGPCLDHI